MHLRHLKYFIIDFLALFFIGGQPVEFGQEAVFFHGFLIENPVIRVGLGTNLTEIRIQSSSGMNIYEVASGYRVISEDAEDAQIKGTRGKLTEKFTLLAAQTKERREADVLAEKIKAGLGLRAAIEEEKKRDLGGIFQVKAGDFFTRGDALVYLEKLKGLGFKDVWILREIVTEEESKPFWILTDAELRPLNQDAVLYFVPSHPQSILSYNGRNYRGIFILRGTTRGVALINVLNLEDYLKGVVPGEMSPIVFGELEALKAQAIAARTYAIKNMGQYRDLGFDLNDTPQSQLYSGMDAEHPLSTRAVEETCGEVARYKGALINALYTSTCGGMTEDVENVFAGAPVPYLKGVRCQYEKQPEWTIKGSDHIYPVIAGGRDISAQIATLVSFGVLPPGKDSLYYRQDASWIEASEGIRAVLPLVGKKCDARTPDDAPLNFIALADLLVKAFDWEERIQHLLLPSEIEFLTKEFPHVKDPDRGRLAYLIQAGLIARDLGPRGPERPVRRSELAASLFKVLSVREGLFHRGVFRGAESSLVEVTEDGEARTLRLAPEVFLLRNLGGEDLLASRLTLLGGEKAEWIEKDGEVKLLNILYPPNTNTLDRSSRLFRWEVRKSRQELEEDINQYFPIGHLVDVSVRRRGSSQRVVELQITGTESQVIARGLKVRWALGLRDTLFVIDREYDDENRPAHFTFSGRGWGHGVGLCQVGSFGMAQAGAGYREILGKYYRGVTIQRLP